MKNGVTRTTQVLFTFGTYFLYLANIADAKTLTLSSIGTLGPFALSFIDEGKSDKGFVGKIVEHRLIIGGSFRIASRVPLLMKTWEEACNKQTPASWTMFAGVVLWTASDASYMLSKKQEQPQLGHAR